MRLHTLPVNSKEKLNIDPPTAQPPVSKTKERMPASTATIPRLISVAEIIKREYLKSLSSKDSSLTTGLHQYNEMGFLQAPAEHEDRTQMVAEALAGTNL